MPHFLASLHSSGLNVSSYLLIVVNFKWEGLVAGVQVSADTKAKCILLFSNASISISAHINLLSLDRTTLARSTGAIALGSRTRTSTTRTRTPPSSTSTPSRPPPSVESQPPSPPNTSCLPPEVCLHLRLAIAAVPCILIRCRSNSIRTRIFPHRTSPLLLLHSIRTPQVP